MRRKGKSGYKRLVDALLRGKEERLPKKRMDLSDLEEIRRSHFFVPCRISLEELERQELSEGEPSKQVPSVPFPIEDIEIADTIQTFMRLYRPSPLQQTILQLFLQGDSLKSIAKELNLPFKTVFNEFDLLIQSWRFVATQFNIPPPITLKERKFSLEVERIAMKMGFVLQGRPVLAKSPEQHCVLQYDGEKWVAKSPRELFKPYAVPVKELSPNSDAKEMKEKINEIIRALKKVGIFVEEGESSC